LKLGNLRAVCTEGTWYWLDQAETRQRVVPYWLSEVMDPLGWSRPIYGDEAWSVLTSGYKSIMILPTAVKLNFSLIRLLVDKGARSREVDNEDEETELAVERSLM